MFTMFRKLNITKTINTIESNLIAEINILFSIINILSAYLIFQHISMSTMRAQFGLRAELAHLRHLHSITLPSAVKGMM